MGETQIIMVGDIVHYSNNGNCRAALILNVFQNGLVDLMVFGSENDPMTVELDVQLPTAGGKYSQYYVYGAKKDALSKQPEHGNWHQPNITWCKSV